MLRSLIVLVLAFALVPVFVVATLGFVPPPVTAFMLQSEVKPVYYQWTPSDQIAPTVAKAVVAAEDQKFWTHSGFDFDAMAEAHARNKDRSRKRGASTISQQTAKNLFLWPGGGYFRKGIEAWLTVLIELLWSKDRILEVYVNVAEFGPGIYGIEAAAQRFFAKSAAKLTAGEAARLAASLPRPTHWHAASGSDYGARRAQWILGQMGHRPRGQPPPVEPTPPEEEEQEDAPIQNPLGEGPEPGVLGTTPAPAPDGEAAPSSASEGATQPSATEGITTYPLPREGGEVVDEPITEAEEEEEEAGEDDE